jgi:chemotaxis methyl-accepting protein methylase
VVTEDGTHLVDGSHSVDRNSEIELRLLIEAIYLKYSYDFRDYSGASIKRRVQHALNQFECATISALQEKVLHDPTAFMQLLQLLTIPVSEMFRDPSHFLAIRKEVVPLLRTYPSLKVWIAGCSTGEEVYSMAILLREEGLLDRTIIYATDINRVRWTRPSRGFSRWRTCVPILPITSRQGASARLPITTQQPMAMRFSIKACART